MSMPTGKTITAREAGVFLPGMRVTADGLGSGRVIIPPGAEIEARAHLRGIKHNDVAVIWDDGRTGWIDAKLLRYEER
jgi:hypothetical protein